LKALHGTTQMKDGSTAMLVVLLKADPKLCRLNISPGNAKLISAPWRPVESSSSFMQPLRIM
jgi:hypothetical protein